MRKTKHADWAGAEGQGGDKAGWDGTVRSLAEDLTEKVALKQRLEEGIGGAYHICHGKKITGRASRCKSPEVRASLVFGE